MPNQLTDDTRIPIRWLFALGSIAGGVVFLAAGLVVWGTRLEAKSEFSESRISKIEISQEQYVKDQSALIRELVEIKIQMQHLRR